MDYKDKNQNPEGLIGPKSTLDPILKKKDSKPKAPPKPPKQKVLKPKSEYKKRGPKPRYEVDSQGVGVYLKDIKERRKNQRDPYPVYIETIQRETHEELRLKMNGKVVRKARFWPAHQRAKFWDRGPDKRFAPTWTMYYVNRQAIKDILTLAMDEPFQLPEASL